MNQGLAMSRSAKRGRPRLIGNRFPGGKLQTEPANAVGAWQRQLKLVNALVLDPVWGSSIAKLQKFGQITAIEFELANKWAELIGHADAIEGMPPRSVRSPSYEIGYGTGGGGRPLSRSQLDVLEKAKGARKAIKEEAGERALYALQDIALANLPPGTDGKVTEMKRALKVLDMHWNRKRRA